MIGGKWMETDRYRIGDRKVENRYRIIKDK